MKLYLIAFNYFIFFFITLHKIIGLNSFSYLGLMNFYSNPETIKLKCLFEILLQKDSVLINYNVQTWSAYGFLFICFSISYMCMYIELFNFNA